MAHTVHLTIKSSNAKTGPIPVSTSGRDTCPDTCNLKNNGCYANSGPLALHWTKVTSGERGTSWDIFCSQISMLQQGQLWRHNQAGDLPHDAGLIDVGMMSQLIKANKGKAGFTYTHHDATVTHNKQLIKKANKAGFTINLSGESFDHADKLMSLDIGPVVTIMPEGMPVKTYTKAGHTVITCPATYKDNISCATCALCQKADRSVIVGFPVHGTSKAKAARVFIMQQI